MKWVELIHKITDEYFDDEVRRETTKLCIHSVATNAAKPFIEATEFGAFPAGSLIPRAENKRSLDQLRKKKNERNSQMAMGYTMRCSSSWAVYS